MKLCKLIKRESILVNVDEVVFSPSTKTNYSWNKKGMTFKRSTTLFSESVSIVSSILSNGISITGVRIGTIKFNTFIEYIEHLIYVWKRLGSNTNRICLFMKILLSIEQKMWKNFWGRINWHAYFFHSMCQTWHLLNCFTVNWREWYEAKGATQ